MTQIMKNDPAPNPLCIDCNMDTDANREQFMILDDLWRAANPEEAGMLCIGCCERRLGRQLRREDFTRYAQKAFDEGMPVSDRLRDRIRLRRRGFDVAVSAIGSDGEHIYEHRNLATGETKTIRGKDRLAEALNEIPESNN